PLPISPACGQAVPSHTSSWSSLRGVVVPDQTNSTGPPVGTSKRWDGYPPLLRSAAAAGSATGSSPATTSVAGTGSGLTPAWTRTSSVSRRSATRALSSRLVPPSSVVVTVTVPPSPRVTTGVPGTWS